MDMLTASQELCWSRVPDQAVALAEKCADTALQVREAIKDLPQDGFLDLWYHQPSDTLQLDHGDWMAADKVASWRSALEPLCGRYYTLNGMHVLEDSVKIAMRPGAARAFLEKQAVSPTLSALSQGLGWRPGVIPGSPNRLTSALTTGLLGAGLGYGAGWLGEKFLPDRWRRGNLRRTLSILGGLGGAGLGAVAGGLNWGGPTDTNLSHRPEIPNPAAPGWSDPNPAYRRNGSLHGLPELEPDWKETEAMVALAEKRAFDAMTGLMPGMDMPPIVMPDFHAAVNLDPRVRNQLSPQMRAAATGLVTGASALSGGTKLVSPLAVGRMAAGMGSGYLSGMLVGKVLGALTGMPAPTQERLKNTGMWAGAIANVLPLAFGR